MAHNQITSEQYIGFRKQKEFVGKRKVDIGRIVAFVLLLVFCIVWISPFAIMFFGSLRGYTDTILYPQELFYPHSGYTLDNYKMLLFGERPADMAVGQVKTYEVGTWIINSCISAIGGTWLYLLVASFAAYAFTFIDFKYRNLLFAIIIASMVIPGAATTVGNHAIVYGMGLHRSLLALIIPGLGGVYGMYLIKTFFESIPKDLIESAKMDGYSNFKIFYKIVLPLGKTVLFVQGLFGFMGGWNDLIWPRMLYGPQDQKLWTLQVGMNDIIENYMKNNNATGAALAGGFICVLPVLVVYIIAQEKIIEGMSSSGIKG